MSTILESTVVVTEGLLADPNQATINISLDALFNLNGTDREQLREVVEGNVRSAMGNGLLTTDLPGPATVESWDLEVVLDAGLTDAEEIAVDPTLPL